MGEANQIIAWTKGAFDGIERSTEREPNGSRYFRPIGITRTSLLAYHRALGGRIAWYEERIEKIRKEQGRGLTRP